MLSVFSGPFCRVLGESPTGAVAESPVSTDHELRYRATWASPRRVRPDRIRRRSTSTVKTGPRMGRRRIPPTAVTLRSDALDSGRVVGADALRTTDRPNRSVQANDVTQLVACYSADVVGRRRLSLALRSVSSCSSSRRGRSSLAAPKIGRTSTCTRYSRERRPRPATPA